MEEDIFNFHQLSCFVGHTVYFKLAYSSVLDSGFGLIMGRIYLGPSAAVCKLEKLLILGNLKFLKPLLESFSKL